MDTPRAAAIAASPVMANVTCDGVQVYIQSVDEERGTCRIFPLDQPEQEQVVAASQLMEH
ncbi:H-type small acid-soluble spore protein [Paenibacillus whitsoniae]|uniref:H-type small acid-soluble spore protein n=1 Tax=Paenibacillus whitsoniae TaxID=2496558 RepID=A0A3S0A3P0_9BACL|nr:H-type small acid-soluble spore protein [Paenibacillus whitsoniae]RTE08785.1 H-type small acid-soluble spore protein [Paenibacillus whitsoniae]